MKKILAALAVVCFASCTLESNVTVEAVIRNESEQSVEFITYGPSYYVRTYKIRSGAEMVESDMGMGYAQMFPLMADSVYIVYNDTYLQKYYNESLLNCYNERDPFNMNAYSKTSVEESKHYVTETYTYTITEDDYQAAVLGE